MTTFHIIGAGLAGATLARELADRCHCRVVLFDQRNHPAGNCHVERDRTSHVLLHVYGPHIFNTNDVAVWNYANRFSEFHPYLNRVKATIDRGVFALPINLHTINQFFGRNFSPTEARQFLGSRARKLAGPARNFEELALSAIGEELYEAFVYGYTKKQWGTDPANLPSSVFKRFPVRFDYNDNYYTTRFQGIPSEGYTALVNRILDHPGIHVELGTPYEKEMGKASDYLFYTGPLDAYFDCTQGRLGYRTVFWERIDSASDILGTAVMNYPGMDVPFTRISEHNHFSPWEVHERHVAFREFSKQTETGDIPYYPTRLPADLQKAACYRSLAENEENTSFLGRLATYRYLNMDQVIRESLDFADRFCRWWCEQEGNRPVFSVDPC